MHCLDCANRAGGASSVAEPAVALCAHCGAAVCYEHARITRLDAPRSVGLNPRTAPAGRRILCTPCAGTTATDSVARPRVGAAVA